MLWQSCCWIVKHNSTDLTPYEALVHCLPWSSLNCFNNWVFYNHFYFVFQMKFWTVKQRASHNSHRWSWRPYLLKYVRMHLNFQHIPCDVLVYGLLCRYDGSWSIEIYYRVSCASTNVVTPCSQTCLIIWWFTSKEAFRIFHMFLLYFCTWNKLYYYFTL